MLGVDAIHQGVGLYYCSEAIQLGNKVSKVWETDIGLKDLISQAVSKTVIIISICYLICIFCSHTAYISPHWVVS